MFHRMRGRECFRWKDTAHAERSRTCDPRSFVRSFVRPRGGQRGRRGRGAGTGARESISLCLRMRLILGGGSSSRLPRADLSSSRQVMRVDLGSDARRVSARVNIRKKWGIARCAAHRRRRFYVHGLSRILPAR